MFYTQHEKDIINRKIRLLEEDLETEILKRQQLEKTHNEMISTLLTTLNNVCETVNELLTTTQNQSKIIEEMTFNVAQHTKYIDNSVIEIKMLKDSVTTHEADLQDIRNDLDVNQDDLTNKYHELDYDIKELSAAQEHVESKMFDHISNTEISIFEKIQPTIDKVDTIHEEHMKAINLSLKYTEYAHRFDQGKPRAEITSSYLDEQGKLNTEIHWNDEFIQNLVKQGFTGNNDQEIVQMWIANLLHQFRENEQN